jgi:hypothetical protein
VPKEKGRAVNCGAGLSPYEEKPVSHKLAILVVLEKRDSSTDSNRGGTVSSSSSRGRLFLPCGDQAVCAAFAAALCKRSCDSSARVLQPWNLANLTAASSLSSFASLSRSKQVVQKPHLLAGLPAPLPLPNMMSRQRSARAPHHRDNYGAWPWYKTIDSVLLAAQRRRVKIYAKFTNKNFLRKRFQTRKMTRRS